MISLLSNFIKELQGVIEILLGGREAIRSGGAISIFTAGVMFLTSYIGIIVGVVVVLFTAVRAVMRLFKADVNENYLRYYQTSDSFDEPISRMIHSSILTHRIQYSNPFHRKGVIILTYTLMAIFFCIFLLLESMYLFDYLARTFSLRMTLGSGMRITFLLEVILILIVYLYICFLRKRAGINKHIRIRRIKGARYDQ